MGSNLRHSHISISYGKIVEKILISPAQHQIHHSVEKKHHDKNFGVTFAIWDYFFNTLVYSQSNQKIKYGLSDEENFSNLENCVYYSVMTHFTVGFGDITPQSPVMRALTIIHVLMAFLLLNF